MFLPFNFFKGWKIFIIVFRSIIIRSPENWTGRRIFPDSGINVVVIFAVINGSCHVQNLSNSSTFVAWTFHFAYVIRNKCIGINNAFSNKNWCKNSCKRLAYRHCSMNTLWSKSACIVFINDFSLVKDNNSVHKVFVQRFFPCYGIFFAPGNKSNIVDVFIDFCLELICFFFCSLYFPCRIKFPYVIYAVS